MADFNIDVNTQGITKVTDLQKKVEALDKTQRNLQSTNIKLQRTILSLDKTDANYAKTKAELTDKIKLNSIKLKENNLLLAAHKTSLKNADTQSKALSNTVNNLTSRYVAFAAGVFAVKKAYDATIGIGLEYNKQLEQARSGLIALSVAVQDKAIPVTERYAIANEEAIETLKDLQAINAETPHTLEQTNKIYKAMFVSMTKAGAATEEMVELTRSISIASGAAGIEFNSLLAGVDGLASGTVLVNSDLGRFLNSLDLTNKKLKESDDVVGLLTESLKDFKSLDTWAEATSNLENEWDMLLGTLTKPLFDELKKDIKETASFLAGINKQLEHLDNLNKKREEFALIEDMEKASALASELDGKLIAASKGGFGAGNFKEIEKESKKAQKAINALADEYIRLNSVSDSGVDLDGIVTGAGGKTFSDKEIKLNTENALALSQLRFDLIAERWDEEEARAEKLFKLTSSLQERANKQWRDDITATNKQESDQIALQQRANEQWRESEQKENEESASLLAKNLETEIQSAFSNIRDFDDFAEALGSAVSSALSQSVATSLSKLVGQGVGGALLGGIGGALVGMAVNALFGGDEKSNAEKAQEEFDTFLDGLNEASQALENFGNIGSSIENQINTLQSEILRQTGIKEKFEGATTPESTLLQNAKFVDGKLIPVWDITDAINKAEILIADYSEELSDVISTSLADTLDISALTVTQLQDLTAETNITLMKEWETELNNIALAMKEGKETAEDITEATRILSDAEFARFQDNKEAFDILNDLEDERLDNLKEEAETLERLAESYKATFTDLSSFANSLSSESSTNRNGFANSSKLLNNTIQEFTNKLAQNEDVSLTASNIKKFAQEAVTFSKAQSLTSADYAFEVATIANKIKDIQLDEDVTLADLEASSDDNFETYLGVGSALVQAIAGNVTPAVQSASTTTITTTNTSDNAVVLSQIRNQLIEVNNKLTGDLNMVLRG